MPSKEVAEEYSELSQKKEAAKATIKWCDRNKDGVQVVRDGQQVFMDADEIATYRQEAQEKLLATFARNGFQHALRVVYTPKNFPLQVVRILVPGLECFNETTARVGVRLRNYVREQI